ncbi:hypothetical protein N9L68_00085 [bacterium]|nr:hypothetical protein [bacterium]
MPARFPSTETFAETRHSSKEHLPVLRHDATTVASSHCGLSNSRAAASPSTRCPAAERPSAAGQKSRTRTSSLPKTQASTTPEALREVTAETRSPARPRSHGPRTVSASRTSEPHS